MMQLAWGLTVTQLNQHIKALLDADEILQDVWVRGEVSNLTQSAAGHVYFTLKDAESSIRCVMWRSLAGRLNSLPAHGEMILARGYVSVYTVQGVYQFYVEDLRPLGAGLLHLEFEALKAKLAAEGLFAPERKRPLPAFPRTIGVVTSPAAAAYQDILRVLRQRFPLVRVILAPTLVQGELAPVQIVEAIRALNRYRREYDIDVIIVARGGGSLEELWAFNDERVARAIAASEVPVISGVGHEIDFTIADFVADHRAPTPTAAAAAAVPDQAQLREQIRAAKASLTEAMAAKLSSERESLKRHETNLTRVAPVARLAYDRQRVDELVYRAKLLVEHRLSSLRHQVEGRLVRLRGLDPQAVLVRGYAIVSRRDTGRTVSSLAHIERGMPLDVRVQDGVFGAIVE